MDYYEELGLSSQATFEEIKEAYRALVRLLHPDHQQDPALQLVAEQQVKKLNKIYSVLSDPEKRRNYDHELFSSRERQKPIIVHAPPALQPRRGLWNRSSIAWTTAVGGFLILLVWMASREVPNTAQEQRDAGASIVELPARTPAANPPAASAPAPAVAPPPIVLKDMKSAAEAEALRLRLSEALGERDAALARLAKKDEPAPRKSEPVRTAAPPPEPMRHADAKTPAAPVKPPSEVKTTASETKPPATTTLQAETRVPEPPLAAAHSPNAAPPTPLVATQRAQHPLAGHWYYVKPSVTSSNKELYPPEFIETTITEENGEVKGTYRARYVAPNRPVSPDVNFQFAGKLDGESPKVPWNGSGGSRGEVTFKLLPDHSLRVDWTASQLGNLGFYRGTALLVKRAD